MLPSTSLSALRARVKGSLPMAPPSGGGSGGGDGGGGAQLSDLVRGMAPPVQPQSVRLARCRTPGTPAAAADAAGDTPSTTAPPGDGGAGDANDDGERPRTAAAIAAAELWGSSGAAKRGWRGKLEATRRAGRLARPGAFKVDRKAKAKAAVKRTIRESKAVLGRIWEVARSESTLLNFVSPPEEDEALTEAQAVQIFWNTLYVELVVLAMMFEPEGEGEEPEPEPLITLVISGTIAGGMAFASVFMFRKVFLWGNSRRVKHSPGKLRRLARRSFDAAVSLHRRARRRMGGGDDVDERAVAMEALEKTNGAHMSGGKRPSHFGGGSGGSGGTGAGGSAKGGPELWRSLQRANNTMAAINKVLANPDAPKRVARRALADRRRKMGARSPRSYRARMMLAWSSMVKWAVLAGP